MDHLSHPFDDELFAGMATAAGLERGDLPTEYDPGHDWGNDSLDTVLPGLPGFTFMQGDDAWFGRLAIHHDEFTYRRIRPLSALVELPFRLSETQAVAITGGRCSLVLDAPGIADWTVASVGPDPDDEAGTVMEITPPPALCQAA